MPLEDGLKFIEALETQLDLSPANTEPSSDIYPYVIFSHPIISKTEELIKELDPRIESYIGTEHERETVKRNVTNHSEPATPFDEPLPFEHDPRLFLPFNGVYRDMGLLVGVVPNTYLQWGDNKQRLSAVVATIINEERITQRDPTKPGRTYTGGKSTVSYFENGFISWFSVFPHAPRTRLGDQHYTESMRYFVPSNFEPLKGSVIHPPYSGLNGHLSHPTKPTDLGFVTSNSLDCSSCGEKYEDFHPTLQILIGKGILDTAQLVMQFASAYRMLYSV